jgi:septum formation protein
MARIVLASASPRRRELLKQIGIEFTVVESKIAESNENGFSAGELAQYLAYEKALSVAKSIARDNDKTETLVIGADTIVVKDQILGKPKDRNDAFKMLKVLQGSWHEVITGVAVISTFGYKNIKTFEITRVKMKELSEQAINAYIDTSEPCDKAGSYGIQGLGAVLVEKIDGCYFNVVGLPLARLSNILSEFGVVVL